MNIDSAEREVLRFLSGHDGKASLTTVFELVLQRHEPSLDSYDDDERIDTKEELRQLLLGMVDEGLLRTSMDERGYEPTFEITDEGQYEASGFGQLVVEGASHAIEASSASIDYATPTASTAPIIAPSITSTGERVAHDSTRWTGTQFVLVDAKVIAEVRRGAMDLKNAVYAMRFESNVDSANLKGLVDALMAICDMVEPEVSVIDRILASPKFKSYAALLAIIATIRGATGI